MVKWGCVGVLCRCGCVSGVEVLDVESSEEVLGVTVTTLVDNRVARSGLGSVWGLSFFVELRYPGRGDVLLFDTGGSPQVFRHNFQALGLDFSLLRGIVISHWHLDHYGAVGAAIRLAGRSDVPVYVPHASAREQREVEAAGGQPVVVRAGQLFAPGVATTGRQGRGIREQGLVVDVAGRGLVVLTGCAHPGVIRMLKAARRVFRQRPLYGVMGGFHISGREEGEALAEELAAMGLRLVSPCHCTGDAAREALRRVLGDEVYRENGAGTVISI